MLNEQRLALAKLDRRTLRRFLYAYRRTRVELHDRLGEVAASKEWTHANLALAYRITDGGLEEIAELLGVSLGRGGAKAVRMGTRHLRARLPMEGPPPPVNVMAVLAKTENLLISRFTASRNRYRDTVRRAMSGHLLSAMLAKEPPARTVNRLMGPGGFLDGEQWQAERIVRTEMANAHEMAMWKTGSELIADGLPLRKKLHSHFDNRTAPDSRSPNQHNLVAEWEQPFREPETGRVYMHPPARPNDRATMLPVITGP